MLSFMRLLPLALALSGCASGSFTRLPGQDEAERIVWHDLYGESNDPPPVEWIDDPDWTIGGLSLPGWKVQVMRKDDVSATNGGPFVTRCFSSTRFAHELMHYHTYLRTGDIDAAHLRGDWDLADQTARQALYDSDL